jgi:hypothetical protein
VPDIHVPKLDAHGSGKSIFKLVLEVALISVGVFLGLAGEQWRERAHQRELSEQALRRFRTELVANRKAVESVREYHENLFKQLNILKDLPPAKRDTVHVEFKGVRPANFNHAAWDLAVATQSLTYMDPDLAYSLSEIYNVQDQMNGLRGGFTQAMYNAPPALGKNEEAFFGAVLLYYGDMTLFEPRLLTMYDEALQKIGKALGK